MIIEMRTYTVQPGSVATVEERFGQALPVRAKLSPLAAFWHTEVGPLNRVIHVWAYDSFEERTRIRAEAQKLQGWPPNVREFVTEQQSEIFLPAPFSPKSSRASSETSTRSAPTREAGRHSRRDRPLEHPDRRAHQAVAPSRRLVLRARRAQPLVPYLGTRMPPSAFGPQRARNEALAPRGGQPGASLSRRTCWSSRHPFRHCISAQTRGWPPDTHREAMALEEWVRSGVAPPPSRPYPNTRYRGGGFVTWKLWRVSMWCIQLCNFGCSAIGARPSGTLLK